MTYVINDLNDEKVISTFNEKKLRKANQEVFRMEKSLRKNVINFMLNRKIMTLHLIVGLVKKKLFLVNTFLNHINLLEEALVLKLIYPIMQEKLISNTEQELILLN